MTNWDKYEEEGHSGLLDDSVFLEDGFITPWTLVTATNKLFGTTYEPQDGYDMIPNIKVELWDVYEGWHTFHYVTRDNAWLWLKSHKNRI
jgi:hypothetical protein